MPIDKGIRDKWLHHHGFVLEGDLIEVYKGRKVKVGTIARITEIKPYNDRYGRCVAHYAYLDNGERTNISNCRLA